MQKKIFLLPSIFLFADVKQAYSLPKQQIKFLLLENIHRNAHTLLAQEGFSFETLDSALTEDELCEKIKDVSALCIRSKTQVTERALSHAKRMMAIAAYCIGTNQIDVKAAAAKGIAVFNAPYSNTRSVVELAIAEMIMLMRNLPDKFARMHAGEWEKSAENSFEIRGKILGIVGYGNIGSQLSVLAESLGMRVCYYDSEEKLSLGNARKMHTLNDLLKIPDVVSLHVDGRENNVALIGEKEFERMKAGVVFLNLSRGHVVDVAALKKNMLSGKILGCGVDVFPYEPKDNNEHFESELRGLPNTILTPHIGGSTLEAQMNIANFATQKLIDYINTGSSNLSVNFPNITLPILDNAHRIMHIHENVPGIMANINQVLARYNINIVGQYLKTNEHIGYVITDIEKDYNKDVIDELKKIEHTIKFRMLY